MTQIQINMQRLEAQAGNGVYSQVTSYSSPWDSPGKNTGVGCHFLLQCMQVKSESELTVPDS